MKLLMNRRVDDGIPDENGRPIEDSTVVARVAYVAHYLRELASGADARDERGVSEALRTHRRILLGVILDLTGNQPRYGDW